MYSLYIHIYQLFIHTLLSLVHFKQPKKQTIYMLFKPHYRLGKRQIHKIKIMLVIQLLFLK